MKKIILFNIILVILLILLCVSCVSKEKKSILDQIEGIAAKNLKNYDFNNESPISYRIEKTPGFVLDYLREMDNIDSYTSYTPSDEEMKMVEQYIQLLPKLHKQILKDSLIAIYFVNNFLGSGMADYVLDENKNIYSILIFNPETLKNNISEWMTYRENTCFIQDNPGLKIEVDCGNKYMGFMYILLHETAHIVDYAECFTPYVEENIKVLTNGNVQKNTPFIENIWIEYNDPVSEYSFTFQKDVTFYGFGNGPKINISDAATAYKQLSQTPYASLYGARNWAEDFAEMVTWYHFTNKLGQPYRIKIINDDQLVVEYDPMDFIKVDQRSSLLIKIY